MLRVVLADAELELVPRAAQGHPSVRSYAQRRGRSPASVLLDSSFHHPALRRVDDGARRGRPDIVHLFLLLCLDSIANLRGELETLVHARGDRIIRVAANTRIPRNYNRFVGLMEDLFSRGVVPTPEDPLLRLEQGDLAMALKGSPGDIILFASGGQPARATDVFAGATDATAVIGGFPRGDFLSPARKLAHRVMSLHPQELKAWTVASEVLAAWNQVRARPLP